MFLLAKIDVIWGFPLADSDSGHTGFSFSTKYVRHAARETQKNGTRTSAIYRFCFMKFMRKMLRSLSKKVIKCTK